MGFLTLGFDPKTHLEDVPIMPKGRYRYALTMAVTVLLTQRYSSEIRGLALKFATEFLPQV